MRARSPILSSVMIVCLLISTVALAESLPGSTAAGQTTTASAGDPLLQLLVSKGVLNSEEAKSLTGTPQQQRARLLELLRQKGILSEADYAELTPASSQVDSNLVASASPILPAAVSSSTPEPTPAKAPAPKVIPAIAPLRVLQLEPSKQDGLVPDLKLGSGAKLKLYGMVKASAIYDSSSPYGTDMPLPGFVTASGTAFDPGPNRSPEFHAKARFARVGANFEWPDIAGSGNAFTGKLEFDFEGNYSRALNRNISTIRSSMASIRLAYGRLDHRFNDDTSVFLLFGQDWTPFGSSTLPNLFETTGLGLGFGTLYERAPQVRFGIGHKVGGSRNFFFQPEFALVMPAFGNDPSNVADQLGYGEKQGADSGRPEVQGRMVFQWQLDKAPGVAPAQLIFSGVQGDRKVMARASDIPSCNNSELCSSTGVIKAAFAHGAEESSNRTGWTTELQLPTRYVTAIGKFWSGSDLRWYFVGSLFSNYTDVAGLTKPCLNAENAAVFCTTPSSDGASTMSFGFDADGNPVLAPQRPVRSLGGFVNLGFPLGRIFGAEPTSRNAGWQLYLHYAFDQAKTRDIFQLGGPTRLGNQRSKNDLGAVTLFWKANGLVSFVLEESMYRTRIADPNLADATQNGGTVAFPIYEGVAARQWHDFRSEFGPIFTF
ncbi:MAG TPA: hypothetical protein VMI10_14460 [Terriglobales bacterium]|nr:hypothetical protein [Terriglobales bacterium]